MLITRERILSGIVLMLLLIATSFTVIADMAKSVTGDAANVISLTKPGAEIHEYQPTPGDIRRAQKPT